MARVFYKRLSDNAIESVSISPLFTLDALLQKIGNVEYVLIDDSNTDFSDYQECLKIENGVLSYDMTSLKATAQNVRKAKIQERFKPYDDIILQINGLAIPEDRLNSTHAELLADAEAERVLIWQDSEVKKQAINNATTANAILAILQDISNDI